jgi:Squalene-hopene cyclase C-terminal domain/Prenyltransferase and squalene oxidase repeat
VSALLGLASLAKDERQPGIMGLRMIEFLLRKQNNDGGWPYLNGGSWTEPSVYAILALLAAGETAPAKRGIGWILRTARPDGGWASRPGVGKSSWVTALATLLPEECLPVEARRRAIHWLLGMRGEDTTVIYALRERLSGRSASADCAHPGWPWTRGAAAWVGPTAAALIALEREQRRRPSSRIAERATAGRNFLLAHMCAEGGWNHGATSAWGYDMEPYPETTGMSLLALRGVRAPQMERALATARTFLTARSADAQNWLRLGLGAHGALPQNYQPPEGIAYRTVSEVALNEIVNRGGLT